MRLIRRLPKRGFNSGNKLKYLLVQVSSLDQFQNETEVTSALVRTIGLAKGDKQAGVKILGEGALTKKLTVRVQAFSESARRKIESAGGKCEVIK